MKLYNNIDPLSNIKTLQERLQKEKDPQYKNEHMIQVKEHLTAAEKKTRIKNYQRYLQNVRKTKYQTPEKKIIFNLAEDFLAKSMKDRNLNLEERKNHSL